MNDKKNETNEELETEPKTDANEEVFQSNAMRVLHGTGQDQENPHASQYGGRKIGWAENFWYQHKWHAGLIIFAVVVACVLLWQFITYVRPDAYIIYAGPASFVGQTYDAFEEELFAVMGDYNGDGKKAISFADNTYLSSEQIAEKQAALPGYTPDYAGIRTAYSQFQMEITAGKHMFCMLDPSLYEEVRDMEGFMPLSEIFGDTLPDCAVDEYGIRLGDTAVYQNSKALQVLPADTVLAVRSSESAGIKGNKKRLKSLEQHVELLRDLVNYTPASEQ